MFNILNYSNDRNKSAQPTIVPIREQNSSGVLTIPSEHRDDSIPTIFRGSFGRTVTRTHELPTRKEKEDGTVVLSLIAPDCEIEA
jgi:hypothetical protein